MAQACLLPDRAIFGIDGPEARDFLQNLLTNNLDQVSPERAIYTLLLTPQGKYLFDFFLVEHDGRYLVECDRGQAPQLLKRLTFYKLRADVTLTDLGDSWTVGALFDGAEPAAPGAAAPFQDGVRFQDPRLPALGTRFLVPNDKADAALTASGGETGDATAYELHRMTLGVPGQKDLIPEKTFPLEANLDILHAIDFHKGCFVGQEVTSRTHRQGTIRKRILPISTAGKMPPAGSAVMAGERQAGEVLSARGSLGLAQLRLDRLDGPLDIDGTDADVRFPDWLPAASTDEEDEDA